MKIRPKIIAASQKFGGGGGVGDGGSDIVYKFHNGCNGTQKSLNAGTPIWSCSNATMEDGCFGRITVCEINCSHRHRHSHSRSSSSSRSNSSTTTTTTTNNNINSHHQCYTTTVNGGLNSFTMGNGAVYTASNSNGGSGNKSIYNGIATTSTANASSSPTTTTKNMNISNDTNNHVYAYALISFIAVMVYLNGINGNFVHDDIPAISLNKDVIGVNKITRSFFNDFWGTPMDDVNSHKSYRPLTVLSFRLNYYLFGLKPIWFHFTNILMHSIVCILFTRVCIIVAGLRDNFAIIAGILFAVHPIHTEAVTGIVGRADILACIFFLISLLVYHGKAYRTDDTSTWLSILFGGLSMLSKETGITVFVVNITYDLYRCWPSLKRTLVDVHWSAESQQCYRRLSKLLISMGILLIIRLALLQGSFPKFSQQDNPTAYHPSFYVRMLTFCYLAAFNWWLVLCPSTLSHDWQMGSIPLLTSISDPRNLLTLWAFASTVLMLHRSLLDFESQRYSPLILGVLLLILPFLPATNLFVTVGFVVAERVLYIPSLGCVLLVVYGAQIMWETMSKYRFIILMGILLITAAFTCKTITRNRDWYSRECLLRAGLRVLPHNAKMHYNFGNFLKDSFQHDTAKQHYREALRLWPTYASAHNNLGTLVNNLDVAENHFLSAIMYASTHVNAHFNLGQLYLKKNRTHEAVRMFKRCTDIDATYVQCWKELFRLFRGSQAALILSDAIKANSENVELRLTLGHWLLNNGLTPAASSTFQWILERDMSHKLAITGICKSMRKLGQWSRLHMLMSRLQTMAVHGGHPYKIDIYLRNWSIRTELQRRAYFYNIENESIAQSELSAPIEQRLNRNDENNSGKGGSISATEPLPATTTIPTKTVYPINLSSGQQQQMYENRSNPANDNDRNHHDRVADQHGQHHQHQQQQQHQPQQPQQQDLLYQKQYCNEIKAIRGDLMRTNDVNIEIISEINTTSRKHTTVTATVVNEMEIDTLRILCENNDLIVDRCGPPSSKSICNFSMKRAALGAKQRPTSTIKVSRKSSRSKNAANAVKKLPINRPHTAVAKCENVVKPSSTSSPVQRPKPKTQNTFISPFPLADILDNI